MSLVYQASSRVPVGPVGLFLNQMAGLPGPLLLSAIRRIDELGYAAVWYGEGLGRETFSQAGAFLANSRQLWACTGIANIWARDPTAMAAGAKTMADMWPGRFVLGLGVSHAPIVQSRGHDYATPLGAMRSYLDAMDQAPYSVPPPAHPAPRVLAALGSRMLELAASRADGAFPYFVPVEHTRKARSILGPDPFLAVDQRVVFAKHRDEARQIADRTMAFYLALDNYRRNLLGLGWTPEDVSGAGSDALFDAIFAWGDEARITDAVQARFDAGANHVALNLLTAAPELPPIPELERLAAALLH